MVGKHGGKYGREVWWRSMAGKYGGEVWWGSMVGINGGQVRCYYPHWS